MSLAVLDRQLTPGDGGVMTFQRWQRIHERLDGCLESRHVHWRCSLVSLPGDRSLCLFEVTYGDLAREACREAASLSQGSRLILAEVSFESPLDPEELQGVQRMADECFQRVDARRLTSFQTLDGAASVCLFAAPCAESVRGVYSTLAVSSARVWPAVLLRPDT